MGVLPLGSSEMLIFVPCGAIPCGLGVLGDLRVEVIGLTKYRKSASRRKGNKAVIQSREMSDR